MTLKFVVMKHCPGVRGGRWVWMSRESTAPSVFLGRAGPDFFSGGSGRIVPLRNALGDAATAYKSQKKLCPVQQELATGRAAPAG